MVDIEVLRKYTIGGLYTALLAQKCLKLTVKPPNPSPSVCSVLSVVTCPFKK
jgi:hypothetical protein